MPESWRTIRRAETVEHEKSILALFALPIIFTMRTSLRTIHALLILVVRSNLTFITIYHCWNTTIGTLLSRSSTTPVITFHRAIHADSLIGIEIGSFWALRDTNPVQLVTSLLDKSILTC